MNKAALKELLLRSAERYNQPAFIASDPIQVPHLFQRKEDIEIAAFFSATLAWGQRKTIIANARELMDRMDMAPYAFLTGHRESDLSKLQGFVHRTFQWDDLLYFMKALQHLYVHQGGLEQAFKPRPEASAEEAIMHFRSQFFALEHLPRTRKHVSDPSKNSSCKRLNMFLRWMCRKDDKGVDFGLWSAPAMSRLSCPLDLHSGRVARRLGLLKRKANDGKASQELDANLRKIDPHDPARFDFALFGLGAFEKF